MKNNNYPNWLVPLYIAKELREIGFREKTFTYFEINTDGEDRYFTPTDINFKELQIYNRYRDYVSIPTWTQVFTWFKKHYYHVNIDDKGTWIHWSFYNEIIEPPIIENEPKDGWETDYYEALEALVVALIKTYKQEQLK